jgi:hypothetical protein
MPDHARFSGAARGDDHIGKEPGRQPEQGTPVEQVLALVLVRYPEQLDDDIEDGPCRKGQEYHAHGLAVYQVSP